MILHVGNVYRLWVHYVAGIGILAPSRSGNLNSYGGDSKRLLFLYIQINYVLIELSWILS
jgi:hypothetical protein